MSGADNVRFPPIADFRDRIRHYTLGSTVTRPSRENEMKMFAVLAATVLAIGPAAAAGVEDGRSSLIAFADAFDQAQLKKDAAALDRMTSSDLIFIDATGKRQGKKEFISGWTAAEDQFRPITLVDRTVTMLGNDAGIVGAEVTLEGVSAGKPFSSRFRFADTFQRKAGRWRAVHIQVTRMP